jgi:hypothetical protein
LNGWRGKFRSGQVVNRAFLALREAGPPVAFPIPGVQGSIPSRFEIRSFSKDETREILARADRQVGYLMLLPFLLAESVRAFQSLALRAGLSEGPLIVPVTMDGRRPGQPGGILFNHFSFHFYRFEADAAKDRAELGKQAVRQMVQQTRDRISEHLSNASDLMRILPAPWLARLMEKPLSGRLGSFSFALLGESYRADSFMGVPVEQLYHMPRVPAPPGIGIYFTRHQGRLNLVVSYLDGMLGAEASALADAIVRGLREESSP